MLQLDNPDLANDPAAQRALKDELVEVEFAAQSGCLQSAVGENHYGARDALLTGSTGDRWCVSRDRFDAKYRPEPPTQPGQAGRYRNRPAPVFARRMDTAFSVERMAGGDRLQGEAGDWLLEYAPGDHGVVARTRFERVYRLID
ncbi:MAG: PGDYG domain-containing protein [Steroidobacteraceae bacterium]